MKYKELYNFISKYEQNEISDIVEIVCEKFEEHELFDHLEHVATIAYDIAENYKLDSEKISIASYLHDISKLINFDEYVEILEKHKVEVLEEEIEAKATLHSKVSYVIAKDIFNISDEEILLSIKNHSSLRANPTEYEKVLFIADKMTWTDDDLVFLLDETVMQVLNVTCKNAIEWIIRDIKNRNGIILPEIIEAYNFFNKQVLF